MMLAPLWRLPEESLLWRPCDRHEDGHWHVMSAPGYGAARAVFIPVAESQGQWEVALDDDEELPLVPVEDGKWTQVRRRGGWQPCRYLCVLRYDLPSNHPVEVDDLALHGGAVHVIPLPPATVTGAELRAVFATLRQHKPQRIARDAVLGPADEGACEAAGQALAEAGQAGPMRAAAAMAAPAPPDEPAENAAHPAQQSLPSRLVFAFASCQFPAGMLDQPVAHASYRALARHLEAPGPQLTPELLLLLGDQVYTDATYGLLDPARLDDRYRMPYEDMRDRDTGPFSTLTLDFLRRVRYTLDDHEIVDNWEPWAHTVESPRFRQGLDAFYAHQRRAPRDPSSRVDLVEAGPGWRLFMADTRTCRQYRSERTLHHALLLGSRQTLELEGWLLHAPRDHLKIVTSAAMLLPRTREHMGEPLYLDNWQGYPASFHRLLAFLCEQQVRNVVFLSGDAHLACRARVRVCQVDGEKSVEFVSCHAPALYAPYPFANESRWNLLEQDTFCFHASVGGSRQWYRCTVDNEIVEDGGDGCGLLTATRTPAGWTTEMQVIR